MELEDLPLRVAFEAVLRGMTRGRMDSVASCLAKLSLEGRREFLDAAEALANGAGGGGG